VMSGTLCLLAITVVVCLTIVLHRLIGRWQPRQRHELPTPADPAAVLAERFAKGEIDEAEYSHRLSVIRLGPPLELR
jgi:putative membrane protein